MRISFNSYQTFPQFCARNKAIRTADCIQRRTNEVFPTKSSTRIDSFFHDSDLKDSVHSNLYLKIYKMRSELACEEEIESWDYCENYQNTISAVSKRKIGNCGERAKAAIGILAANGFYNSSMVTLHCKMNFINKITGETEYSFTKKLGHSFAITDLNKREKQDIVVDPWIGFADYKDNAIIKFRHVFADSIEKQEKDGLETICKKKQEKREDFNADDYETEINFVFAPCDYGGVNSWKRLGERIRKEYPQTVLDINA